MSFSRKRRPVSEVSPAKHLALTAEINGGGRRQHRANIISGKDPIF